VPRRLVIAAGGGGDGDDVFRLGVDLLRHRRDWSGTLIAGPYADPLGALPLDVAARVQVATDVRGCAGLFASAHAVLQMAGYNSTVEALATGIRPILAPRRRPRREQAIRASRLAAWGLADVVDAGADADEVGWLLDQPRRVAPGALARAGIGFDGAERTAARLGTLVATRSAA
jgi:predicted glycosyltransferase